MRRHRFRRVIACRLDFQQPEKPSMVSRSIDPSEPSAGLAALPRLGVGLSHQASLSEFVLTQHEAFDFLEIVPDTLWRNFGPGSAPRYVENSAPLAFLERAASRLPLVAHSIGLTIGSADPLDTEHVAQVASWQARYHCPWHSDHLSFSRFDNLHGAPVDIGVTMPVPYDAAVLEMLVERVNTVQAQVPVPFLLENNVYYFDIPEQEMTEAQFLNNLTARTGCGLLLDLHNVYTNGRNHGFDPWGFIGDLDLSRVVEVHIGGGMMLEEFYLDAHSGPAPDAVWSLLDELLPHTPNICGVVFELFDT
jgi:uncharacterized protein (UPF0276 family)